MIIKNNVKLSEYTTFKMGGECETLYCPETEKELIDLLESIDEYPLLLGGGSNIIINDQRRFDKVICLRNFNNDVTDIGDGRYEVGGSVRLQHLINRINKDGYGGIEYLYSVPGLVGGAIVMNAGRGKKFNRTISDYVVSVKIWENGIIKYYNKDECDFRYRSSKFKQQSGCVVLSVEFAFEEGDSEYYAKEVINRIELVKRNQDLSYPNCGSIFAEYDFKILDSFKWNDNNNGKVVFSKKTTNWLLNKNGTFADAMTKIEKVCDIHDIEKKKYELEVIIWR